MALTIESQELSTHTVSAAVTKQVHTLKAVNVSAVISLTLGTGIPSFETNEVAFCDKPLHGTHWGALPKA